MRVCIFRFFLPSFNSLSLFESEFRVWLLSKKIYFDDLDSDAQRSWFKKFVVAWNTKQLPEKLYKGVHHSSLSASERTTYKWGFTKRLTDEAKDDLESGLHFFEFFLGSRRDILSPHCLNE